LEFRHPGTKAIIAVTAPVGAAWKDFLPLAALK
jgi:hypothetical protein